MALQWAPLQAEDVGGCLCLWHREYLARGCSELWCQGPKNQNNNKSIKATGFLNSEAELSKALNVCKAAARSQAKDLLS